MKNKQMISTIAAALLLLVSAASSLHAGEASQQLQTTTNALLETLKNPELRGEEKRAARRSKLAAILKDRFALRQMARLTISTAAWKQASDEQKERFFKHFEALLERSYLDEIDSYQGQQILFQEERIAGKTGTVVTLVTRPESEDLPITYRVLKRGETWVVYDVVINGVSAVRNYRDQFSEILADGGFADLLKKLEAKKRG